SLYSFVNDFGTAPVNIVDFDDKNGKVVPLYSIKKFKKEIKEKLVTDIILQEQDEKTEDEVVGRIKITHKGSKTKKRILTTYPKEKYSLEYSPKVIVHESTKYILKHPLRCLFEKEDDYFIIHAELLNLIGTGLTE